MFTLDDVDFTFSFDGHSYKISDFTTQDTEQIQTIADAIIHSGVLDCKIKAIICAFQLYIESLVETTEWASSGKSHH